MAYAISFLTIGIIWVNHHTVLQQIDRVDRTFLFINVVFLMIVAFIPFPTRVLAEHLRDGVEGGGVRLRPDVHADGDLLRRAVVLRGARPAADRRRRRPARRHRHLALVRARLARSTRIGDARVAHLGRGSPSSCTASIALFYVLESSLFGRDG